MTAQRNLLFTTSLFALALAAPTFAQDATTPVQLDTVVLTSSDQQTASTTPQAHVDRAEIEHSQAGSVVDLLKDVPGVTGTNSDNLLTSTPAIRGFGAGKHMANDPNVLMTVDGVSSDGGRVYQNASGMIADPALLKSVDVLQGPLASLEYGSGIAGGTVAARTIDASDLTEGKPGYRFRQYLGANSNGKGWVTSSTLAWQPNEDVEFLANYSRRRLDKQKDGDGKEINLDGFNLPSYLLKARYTFGAERDQALSFSYNRFQSAERDVPYGQATGAAAFGNVNRDRKGDVASVTWEWNPSANPLLNLELQYSHSRQKTNITFLPGSIYGGMFGGDYTLNTDRVTLKNTAQFQTGIVSHSLKAGLDFSRQKRDNLTMMNPSGKINRAGFFVIDDMDFGSGLTVSSGLRIEHQKIEGASYGGPGRPGVDQGPFKTTARTGGLGVSQELGNGFRGFASFAYGEGLATLDVLSSRSIVGADPYADRTEKSRNWEGGLAWANSDLGNGISAAFQLTAYQTELWDVNTGVSRGGEITRLKMRGVGASGKVGLTSGLYAKAGVSITHNDEASLSRTSAERWQDYSYAPADNGYLTVGQVWQNGLDVSWTLRGAKSIDINGTDHAGYGTHDLKVSYAPQNEIFAGATVDFAVENVFDKTYRDAQSYFNEPGRNVSLSLAKTF